MLLHTDGNSGTIPGMLGPQAKGATPPRGWLWNYVGHRRPAAGQGSKFSMLPLTVVAPNKLIKCGLKITRLGLFSVPGAEYIGSWNFTVRVERTAFYGIATRCRWWLSGTGQQVAVTLWTLPTGEEAEHNGGWGGEPRSWAPSLQLWKKLIHHNEEIKCCSVSSPVMKEYSVLNCTKICNFSIFNTLFKLCATPCTYCMYSCKLYSFLSKDGKRMYKDV